MKHLKGFARGFTELHAKLDADTLLNFSLHTFDDSNNINANTLT
jgi:hypothetical protein